MKTLSATAVAILLATQGIGRAQEPKADAPEAKAPDAKALNARAADAKKDDKAVPSLTELGGKTFEQWKLDLRHQDASVRVEAILAISLFGAVASEAVPLLIERCLDRDASPRVKAVIVLSLIEVEKKDVSKVIDCLAKRISEDGQSIVRYQAAVTLQRFAEESAAKNAIGALLRGCEDTTSYEIRALCLSLLRQAARDTIKGPEYRVSTALLRAVKDGTSQVRLEAVMALGALGRSADETTQEQVENALRLLVRDRDKAVGIWAQVGLLAHSDKVTESQVMTLAQPLMSEASVRMRLHTARALAAIGPKAKVAMPTLLRALDDKDKEVVAESILALAAFGEPNERVLKAMTDLSKRKGVDENLKQLAEAAVAQLKKPPVKK